MRHGIDVRPQTGLAVLTALALAFAFVTTSPATPPAWTPLGLGDAGLTGIDEDDFDIYAFSPDGFRVFDYASDVWVPYLEPGVPGRTVTAVAGHSWLDVPLLTARVDAADSAYITIETLDGQPGVTTYKAACGPVTAFAVDQWWLPLQTEVWAALRAGAEPGRLIRSPDSGATWTEAVGHGMSDVTGVVIVTRYHEPGVVYVSGDAGIVMSEDSGATWQPFDQGLPPGGVVDLQAVDYPTGIPGKAETGEWPLMAATDQGIYARNWDDAAWQLVLPGSFRKLEVGSTAMALADDGSLWGGYSPYDAGSTWEDWSAAFAGETILDITMGSRFYVLTDVTGVHMHDPRPNAVPAAAPPRFLRASPNPFNPRTSLAFSLAAPARVDLEIFDVAGRPVRRLLSGADYAAGTHAVTWDGRGDGGRSLPSGVYFCRLRTEGGERMLRATLIK